MMIFFTIFIIYVVYCIVKSGSGCVDPDDFGGSWIKVPSNPKEIDGKYNDKTGGQAPYWMDTALLSDGNPFVIQVKGAWSPWNGESKAIQQYVDKYNLKAGYYSQNESKLAGLQKEIDDLKVDISNTTNKTPDQIKDLQAALKAKQDELTKVQNAVKNEQQDSIDYSKLCVNYGCYKNDSAKTSCFVDGGSFSGQTLTKRDLFQQGSYKDYYYYYYQSNIGVDEAKKHSDSQKDCVLDSGFGLYMSLWGEDGVTSPERAYHLMPYLIKYDYDSDQKNGRRNMARYYFLSTNDAGDASMIQKNAKDYHKENEVIKLTILDRYYTDNYGDYYVKFLAGAYDDSPGLFEEIVKIFEDLTLGKVDKNTGQRFNGYLYDIFQKIVYDNKFASLIRMGMVFYVMFFGMLLVTGATQITHKEMATRAMKIALILGFTAKDSWNLFNSFVIDFFVRGVGSIIAIYSSSVHAIFKNTPIEFAVQGRSMATTSAPRFAYADDIADILISEPVFEKMLALLFGDALGVLYILIIGFIIYSIFMTLILAVNLYIASFIQVAIALAAGPIFISFALFSKTMKYFKKWVVFLAARGMEVIMFFIVFFTFLVMIAEQFKKALSFSACWEGASILGLFRIAFLSARNVPDFSTWLTITISMMAMIFLTSKAISISTTLSSSLTSVQGSGAGGGGAGATGSVAGAATKLMADIGNSAFSNTVGSDAYRSLMGTAPLKAAGALVGATVGRIPGMNAVQNAARKSLVNSKVEELRAEGIKAGKSGADLDKFIRTSAYKHFSETNMGSTYNSHTGKWNDSTNFTGMTRENLDKALDNALIKKPMKKHLEAKAGEFRKQGLSGQGLHDKLKAESKDWLNKNSALGEAGGKDVLKRKDMKNFINELGSFRDSGIKRFADATLRKVPGVGWAAEKLYGEPKRNQLQDDKVFDEYMQRLLKKGRDDEIKTAIADRELVKTRGVDGADEIQKIKKDLDESQIKNIEKFVKEYPQNAAKLEKKYNDRIAKIESEEKALDSKIKGSRSKSEKAALTLEKNRMMIENEGKKKELINKREEKLRELTERVVDYGHKVGVYDGNDQYKQKLEEFRNTLKDKEDENKRLEEENKKLMANLPDDVRKSTEENREKIQELQEKNDKLAKDLNSEAKKEIEENNKQIKEIENKIDRDLPDDVKGIIEENNKQIEANNAMLSEYVEDNKSNIERILEVGSGANEALLKESNVGLEVSKVGIGEKPGVNSNEEEMARYRERVQAHNKRVDDQKSMYDSLKKSTEISKKIKEMQVKNINISDEDRKKLEIEIKHLDDKLSGYETQINSLESSKQQE